MKSFDTSRTQADQLLQEEHTKTQAALDKYVERGRENNHGRLYEHLKDLFYQEDQQLRTNLDCIFPRDANDPTPTTQMDFFEELAYRESQFHKKQAEQSKEAALQKQFRCEVSLQMKLSQLLPAALIDKAKVRTYEEVVKRNLDEMQYTPNNN